MLRALLNLKRWGIKKNSPYLEIKTLADYSRDLFVAVVSSHPITAGQKRNDPSSSSVLPPSGC